MTSRLLAVIVTASLCAAVSAQTPAPALTKSKRELLRAILAATDAASAGPDTDDVQWQSHVMRASDGSHYLAFIAVPAGPPLPAGPAIVYVRLATVQAAGAPAVAERSAISEWLAGSRIDPRLQPRHGIAIGDMPAFGAGAIAARGSTASTGSTDLSLMALDRERARQEEADREKERRAELEGRQAAARVALPFEDFDLASGSRRADGTRVIARALTAGPGDYALYLAWADPAAAKPLTTIRVMRKSIHLPVASRTELTTGSIILADSVSMRPQAYPPSEQASHPYSIGLMEIVPAASARYGRENNLSLAFQIINAQSSDVGMPDLAVGFRIVRVTGGRETAVASLNPQYYNATTLPPDFDLRLGHPLFAAVTAPLATLPRGDYRLKAVVNDHVARTSTGADADFSVIGTPASLLAEAPPLGRAFDRYAVLAVALPTLLDALTPPSPSPALARALATARSGKLVALLVEEPVPPPEAGIRTALTGLALLSVGDASAALQFRRAMTEGAAAGPMQFLIGAARAAESRDADAIVAWQAALAAGSAPPLTAAQLAEAYLRRGDGQHAAAALADARSDPDSVRISAAVAIANGREADALAQLDARLVAEPGDQPARWLLLQALYARFVHNDKPAQTEIDRFATEAKRYIDAKGANAALLTEWLAAISF